MENATEVSAEEFHRHIAESAVNFEQPIRFQLDVRNHKGDLVGRVTFGADGPTYWISQRRKRWFWNRN